MAITWNFIAMFTGIAIGFHFFVGLRFNTEIMQLSGSRPEKIESRPSSAALRLLKGSTMTMK